MSKARITVTFEYEVKPEHYPDDMNLAEMVQLDVSNFHDLDSLFDALQSHEFTVVGGPIGDDGWVMQ